MRRRASVLALVVASGLSPLGCGLVESEDGPGTSLTAAGEGGAFSSPRDGAAGSRGDGSNARGDGSAGGRNDGSANRGDGRAHTDAGTLGSGDATLDAVAEAAPHGGPQSADASDIVGQDGSICKGVDPATLLGAPIIPPYAAAGIDLYGGPLGNGAEGWNPADPSAFHYDPSQEGTQPSTITDVKSWICDPGVRITVVNNDAVVNLGIPFDFFPYGGYALYFYADTGALNAIQIQALGGFNGTQRDYQGTMEATASDGTHYSVGLGRPILKTPLHGTAAPLVFPPEAADVGAPTAATKSVVNELYGALLTQFMPSAPVPADCFAASACSVFDDDPHPAAVHDGGPLTAQEILLLYPALNLALGVRVLPGTGASEPGNSVVELYLSTDLSAIATD